MKTLNLTIIAVLLFFFSGCVTNHSTTRPDTLDTNPLAQQNKKTNDGIESIVYPITNQSMQKKYFDNDIVKNGFLPIQINILNKRDNNITFTTNSVTLLTPEGTVKKPVSGYEVAQHVGKSFWRKVGWKMETNVFGLIPSVLNVSKTDKRIQEKYEARSFVEGDLAPGAMVDGLTFFKLSEGHELKTLDGYTVNIELIDNIYDRNCNIRHPLYGDINYQPKETQGHHNGDEK